MVEHKMLDTLALPDVFVVEKKSNLASNVKTDQTKKVLIDEQGRLPRYSLVSSLFQKSIAVTAVFVLWRIMSSHTGPSLGQ